MHAGAVRYVLGRSGFVNNLKVVAIWFSLHPVYKGYRCGGTLGCCASLLACFNSLFFSLDTFTSSCQMQAKHNRDVPCA